MDLFPNDGERKDDDGEVIQWEASVAKPRLGEYSFRTGLINPHTETREFLGFAEHLKLKGLDRSRS